jgi:hypothetical protein
MFGFPIGNGNVGFNDFVEKFTNNADSGFPKIQQREVFYSIKDGNWNDLNTWQTASGRVGLLPTANDDVYIRHSVTNTTLFGVAINNLFITGLFTFGSTGQSMTVFGNLKCTGTLQQNTGSIILHGIDNYINNYTFTNGSEAGISYARNDGIPQPIMPLTYLYVGMSGISQKYLVGDLVQSGTQSNSINSAFDTRGYNVTYNGSVFFNTSIGDFVANGSTLIFGGLVTWNSIRRYEVINSTLEFRNGWTWLTSIGTFANSVINFTTNTQNVRVNFSGGDHVVDANSVNIVGNITLNIADGNDFFVLNCPINGTTASSNLTNKALLRFATSSSVASMTTGIFDRTTFANTVGYVGNYSITLPYATYHSLTISGTGTKTLGGNTTLNGNLLTSGIFQLSTFDLTVTGTSATSGATGFISKNSTGNILFIGAVSLGNGSGAGGFNFSGNPNIEFRNGLTTNNNGTMVMGSGNYNFTTNNQTIFFFPGGTYVFPNATIVGAITLTWTGGGTNVSGGAISGFITNPIGTVAGSTLINNGNIFFNGLPSGVMSVGVFNITTYANNVTYNYNGNDTLPFTTYSSLTIGGSGTKTLNGNTIINGAVAIYGNSAVFECSTYNLTVNGAFGGQTSGTIISKTGSGSLLFVGAVSTNTINWVLTGNPTIEFRNGLILSNINTSIHNTGTGQITFSTNNQNITWNNILTFNNDILISGAITVTQGSVLYGTSIIMKGILNGNNSLSKWLMGTLTNTMNYQNATQPMATGILDTSTNLNTWIYGLNNQNIKGSPTISPKQVYRNLTLNGTGVKTLQGYVSVLNTYTLTAPATLALNGFTLTNP